MKRLTLMPALLALGATPLLAQNGEDVMPETPQENVTEVFDEVDSDGNGILSIEEARDALPEFTIEDSNNDGWLNHAEIDSAVPELDLSAEDAGGYSVVGESDYLEIRQQINDPASAG